MVSEESETEIQVLNTGKNLKGKRQKGQKMDSFNWTDIYASLCAGSCNSDRRVPMIGITGNLNDQTCTLAEGYWRAVLNAGCIPVIIPPYEETANLGDMLDRLDGILLSGGGDINPPMLGEEPVEALGSVNPVRDVQELVLVRLATDRQIPMLGICRGVQVLAAALGGEVYQDMASQMNGKIMKHNQQMDRRYASHNVEIETGSVLHSIFGRNKLAVNSFHHQAVKTPPKDFKVSARSADGVIEAIESTEYKSIIGVQWHPECFCLRGAHDMDGLFGWLAREARSFMEAKRLHERILTFDSHCDTPMFFGKDIDFGQRDPQILVDLHKMHEGRLDAAVMAAYLPQGARDEESLLSATAKADQIITRIEELAARHCTEMDIAYVPDDLSRLKREGKKAVMIGIENGYAVGKDIRNVEHFRKRGVVYMTLCHNGDNDICDSARGNGEHGGVSEFGAKVIGEMNRTGMMVDLSHGAESSFYDALEISRTPIVCSHSSAKALCNHPRNLTDEQMKALAKRGGVAQVTLYHGFLREEGEASIMDAVEHLNHMVNVMGIEHVGIGTDFDGDGGVSGCASASEVINFTRKLMAERYSEKDIALIWGGNFLRVMDEVQRYAGGNA